MSIEQLVLEKLKQLPLAKQQEVLDFVDFLLTRLLELAAISSTTQTFKAPISALEAAGSVVGCVDEDGAPVDLSSNPSHLEGFGL